MRKPMSGEKEDVSAVTGRVHSLQSLGAVDGPGLRAVVFLQGCPLRCVYCHNPDTWVVGGGERYTAQAIFEKVQRFRPYFGKSGGVTVSGGEPLLQGKFVAALFRLLRQEGIHTALDTSGMGSAESTEAVLAQTDLVLCDLKFSTEADYQAHCGGSLQTVLAFLKRTEERGIPLWIRHVVVPGLTDNETHIRAIARMAKRFSNLEKLELLPFQTFCQVKYDTLGIPFPLQDCPPCPDETIQKLERILREEGC